MIVQVVDARGATADARVSVVASGALAISPPAVTFFTKSSITFSGYGGAGGYSYSVQAGDGSIDPVTGLYTAPGVSGSATVTVTDSASNSAHATVTVTAPQPLAITPSLVSVLASDNIQFYSSGGSGGYVFSVYSGGGSINAAGGLYSAPASPGTAIVRVTDGSGDTSNATVTIVGSGLLSIHPTSVVVPVNGTASFEASGGMPPYVYSVQSGDPGSINSVTGLYYAPEAISTATVIVRDNDGHTASALVSVAGVGCGSTFTESEPNDEVGQVNDFGISLVPGCSVTITGRSDLDGDSDFFAFDPSGTAYVAIVVTWNSGNELDLYVWKGGDEVADAKTEDSGSETLLWKVDSPPGLRYLELEVKGNGGRDYEVTLTGM